MTRPTDQWLTRPELSAVWDRLHDRLERNGGHAAGEVVITAVSRPERHALGDLLGSPVVTERVRVDLAALERRLVERTAYLSLAKATEALTGRPLRNRPREREERLARRRRPAELARSLADEPWVEEWVGWLYRSGVLARATDGEALVRDALEVLRTILEKQEAPGSRVELAARVLGDAHALDEDTALHAVVLRGLAATSGAEMPTGVLERRALWEQNGINADLLSATCLVLGIRSASRTPLAERLRLAAAAGDPLHLTAWDLRRRGDAAVDVDRVLVCENPRVLESIAQRFASDFAVVCSSGQPNTVVTEVLAWLRKSGCDLRYHGDFDWPGIAITNRMVAQHAVAPWLMSVADYESGLHGGGPPLVGTPGEACWDPDLGAAMREHGIAVHEETVLDRLLCALEEDSAASG